ncbi:MAG: sigma-70 family RNA polymerase sigma factor [Clostridia bacterium]|nr:sigma-70 family RNA polymerase sigma factor [Clostridia bacterium]
MKHLLGLFFKFQKDLYCIAKMKIKNENDIEDIIQETMLSAYTNLKKLKNNKFFKTWIIRILLNNCKKFYKRKNFKSLDDKDGIEKIPTNEIDLATIEFENFISFLPEEERTILTLYYSLNYTTKEIAQILQKREGTICSKISRAKVKIKEKYKGEFY